MTISENQCPAWDQFVLPILQLATTQEVSRKIAKEEVPKMMVLSSEIMEERLNSGARRVDNRIGWAMSHLTKTELIEKVKRATYGITDEGKAFFEKYRNEKFTYHRLEELEGYKEA